MPLPAEGTIKRRLLDDLIANPMLTPDGLGKRHGLNGHDLVKNLEQLRKEGFVQFTWGAGDRIERVKARVGAVNGARLEGSTAANDRLRNEDSQLLVKLAHAISKLPWRSDDWRTWDPDLLRQHSGLSIYQISGGMKTLREQGRVQQLGGGGVGKRIEGVRWRGEHAPAATEEPKAEESATLPPETPSGPSPALSWPTCGFPMTPGASEWVCGHRATFIVVGVYGSSFSQKEMPRCDEHAHPTIAGLNPPGSDYPYYSLWRVDRIAQKLA